METRETKRIIIVPLAEQDAPSEPPPPRTAVILDNGSFPKTRPCSRKRTRSRWKRRRSER